MDKRIIAQVVDQKAESCRMHIAIETPDQSVSYEMLQQAYRRFAFSMPGLGTQRGEIVATFLPPSVELVCSLLGCNLAGCAILPLAVHSAEGALTEIITKVSPRIFITDRGRREALLEFLTKRCGYKDFCFLLPEGCNDLFIEKYKDAVCIDRQKALPGVREILPSPDANDRNYLVPATGPTGKLRIIEGRHKSLSHFIHWEIEACSCSQHTKVGLLAPVSVDGCLREILLPLSVGGTICIPDGDVVENPSSLLKWVSDTGINLLHLTPSRLKKLTDHLSRHPEDVPCLDDLRHILLYGETLNGEDVNRWWDIVPYETRLLYLYGPPETTLAKMFYPIERRTYPPGQPVPAGKPLSNTTVLILNRSGRLCNKGEIGEICIRTPFKAIGYYKDPDLTRRKFFQNPLHADYSDLIFATGDRGKYMEDGLVGLSGPEEVPLYPVTYAQKRLWIQHQLKQSANSYLILLAATLGNHIDTSLLKRVFEAIVERHESLRTTFYFLSGEVKQRIQDPEVIALRELDESMGVEDDQAVIDKYLAAQSLYVFDLEEGPLMLIDLVKLPTGKYLLLLTMHHIISDGWSVGVLVHEISRLYLAYSNGLPDPLPRLKIQYKDYAIWQDRQLKESLSAHKEYWNKELYAPIPAINLPYDLARPEQKSFRGRKHRFYLDRDVSGFLRQTASDREVSLFVVIMTLIYILLYRYSGQEDILVGTPVSGRDHPDLENQVGLYLNYLVLRSSVRGEGSFDELLTHVKQKVLSALDHQQYPYDELVDDLIKEPSGNRNPFYDVLVVMNNADLNGSTEDMDSLETVLGLNGLDVEDNISKLDLSFFISDLERIRFSIEYSTDLFRQTTIERMQQDIEYLASNLRRLHRKATIDELADWEDNSLSGIGSAGRAKIDEAF